MQSIEITSVFRRLALAAVLGLSMITVPVSAQKAGGPDVKVANGVLTNLSGMTLYTWDNDPPAKSVCNLGCSMSWPPLLAKEGAQPSGDYSIITRRDDRKQWAYKGKPLYRWDNDKKPGDRTGDGLRSGTWHVATP